MLKSLATILAIWLSLNSVICSSIALFFALEHSIFFPADENGISTKNWYWPKSILYSGLCDFEMDTVKWPLTFLSRNFGLKTYLWFQFELGLSAYSRLKLLKWFQTKLHSTQLITITYLIKSILWYNKPTVSAKLQYNIWNSPTGSTLDRMIVLPVGLNVCSLTVCSFMPGRLHPERFFLIIDWLCRIPLVILVVISFLVRSDALNL